MNFLFVSVMEGFPWGGSEELWYQTALKALEQGHQVMVCVKGWSEEPAQIKLLRDKGAVVIKRKIYNLSLTGRIEKKLTAGYRQNGVFAAIRKFSPDVILISQGGTFDFVGDENWWPFINLLKKPFSVICQSNLETGCIADPIVTSRLKESNPWFTKFYFVSLRNLETAQRQAAITIGNAALIDNPVNIKNIGIRPWPASKQLKMASVARYQCSYKGQDILIQALSHQDFQPINFQLDLYGKGPDKEYLAHLIRWYKLEKKITVNEHVADIDAIWDTHHVLVLSSIAEGTPLALQECMLKGRPALVTDVGDCSRLIKDNETGFLVEAPTPRALQQGLHRLFSMQPVKLKSFGDKAYATAVDKIDLNASKTLLQQLRESVVR